MGKLLKNDNLIFLMVFLFLFTAYFIPTTLPFRLGFILLSNLIFMYSILIRKKVFAPLEVNFFLFTIIISSISLIYNSVEFVNSLTLALKPLFFIIIQIYGVLYLTKSVKNPLKICKVIYYFTFILSMLLIFEAFFYNVYYNIFGYSAVPEEMASQILGKEINGIANVTNMLGISFRRPFGPFRYQLLAGFTLLLGGLINYAYYLNSNNKTKKIIYLISLVIISFAMILTSKTAFGCLFAGLLFIIIKSKYIKTKSKIILTLFMLIIIFLIIYILFILPIIYGLGVGSGGHRADIYSFMISKFFSMDILTVLLGHGFGFTWYGNSSFVNLYSEATSDYGMYLNILLQSGILGLMFIFISIFYMLTIKVHIVDKCAYLMVLSLKSYILCFFISWLTLSNYDLLFWLFLAIGLIYSFKFNCINKVCNADI